MQAKIQITQKLDNDLYAQYKAIYLSDEVRTVTSHSEVVDKIPTKVLYKNDKVSLNFDPVKQKEFEIGTELNVTCIETIYASNPEKGILLTIIKILE